MSALGIFETPFLLLISYQELVGAVINVDKNTFTLRNSHKTSTRRTPSGHRAIPIHRGTRRPHQLRRRDLNGLFKAQCQSRMSNS